MELRVSIWAHKCGDQNHTKLSEGYTSIVLGGVLILRLKYPLKRTILRLFKAVLINLKGLLAPLTFRMNIGAANRNNFVINVGAKLLKH